jgi:hypothetical protein
MTSTPAEPDQDPQVAPSGDPTPDGPGTRPGDVPQGPQETGPGEDPEDDVPLDADEGDPDLSSYPG